MKAQLDLPLSLEEIARILELPCPEKHATVRAVVTDSREAVADDLFFAFDGRAFCGNNFTDDVFQKGGFSVGTNAGCGVLTVRDTKAALMALAKAYKKRLPFLKKTVAITGSVGKTTTKELLLALLSPSYRVHATKGNYNNEIGMPMTILSAPRDTEILILEIGINHPGEMTALSSVAEADIAILTNVGHAHIGNFGSEEQLLHEKLSITEGMPAHRHLILPAGDPRFPHHDVGVSSVSLTDRSAPFALLTEELRDGARTVTFFKSGKRQAELCLPFDEEGAYSNCALAMSAAYLCEGRVDTFEQALWQQTRAYLRTKERVFFGGGRLLDDAYNASPESMEHALRSLSQIRDTQRCVLLGDMLELGSYTEAMHRDIGKRVSRCGVERAFFYGVYAPFYRLGAVEGGMDASRIWINNDITSPELTVQQILSFCSGKETLLCKASRGIHLEAIIDRIIAKSPKERM